MWLQVSQVYFKVGVVLCWCSCCRCIVILCGCMCYRSTSRCTAVCLQVFQEYFKELEEESIRDNFVIVYELLDELMDFGYPQTTDSKILQE